MEQMTQDAKKGNTITRAVLTKQEFDQFLQDFGVFRWSKGIEIRIIIKDDSIEVVLGAGYSSGFLLYASLKDGVMHHLGWHKKFKIEK